jgi:excisionase family DNA binding protein
VGIIASQAARELGLSARTLATWADKGRIKSVRSNGGWRLYDEKDVQRLKRVMAKRQRETQIGRARRVGA